MPKVECPEHALICDVLDVNHEILIHGDAVGYGAEINWCQVIKLNIWNVLIKKIISSRTKAMYAYANESFNGRTSDTCWHAIDLIGSSNVCYCPERIKAYYTLNIDIGENIIYHLTNLANETMMMKYTTLWKIMLIVPRYVMMMTP
jgi:hypothetical protein